MRAITQGLVMCAALVATAPVLRIRAEWHTDPAALLHLGSHFPLTVEILGLNGRSKASQEGFSIHAPSDKKPKLDLSYYVTDFDTTFDGGSWSIRVTSKAPADIVDFRLVKPGVIASTFHMGCR